MNSLIKTCRVLCPYLVTAAGTIELDNVLDVAPFIGAILVPAAVCLGVTIYAKIKDRANA